MKERGTTRLLGWGTLKREIAVSDTEVECPVLGCVNHVERQRKHFRNELRFTCREHGIVISPTTFEYHDIACNLLDPRASELSLLNFVLRVKRECRMVRDNSEDALVWNVFRYLERRHLLAAWGEAFIGVRLENPKAVYWSCAIADPTKAAWQPLLDARVEFGEVGNDREAVRGGSEPDLILVDNDNIVFVEAKLTASNRTPGDSAAAESRARNPKRYTTGGGSWFHNVFSAEYSDIVLDRKYELLRFWLLGTWMAQREGKRFHLVNLVRATCETNIAETFGRFVDAGPSRTFHRTTWEDIHAFVSSNRDVERRTLMHYLENKVTGYSNGKLRPAFTVARPASQQTIPDVRLSI
jgi:hypothetical protein